MTLTEQWKKGELEWGKNYYCRNVKTNETNICFLYGSTWYSADSDGEGDIDWQGYVEVLAPVPSYDEWQDAENRSLLTTEFSNEIDELNEENQQLKELLKECYKMLAQYHVENSEPSLDENIQLLTKIDNATGEKK